MHEQKKLARRNTYQYWTLFRGKWTLLRFLFIVCTHFNTAVYSICVKSIQSDLILQGVIEACNLFILFGQLPFHFFFLRAHSVLFWHGVCNFVLGRHYFGEMCILILVLLNRFMKVCREYVKESLWILLNGVLQAFRYASYKHSVPFSSLFISDITCK